MERYNKTFHEAFLQTEKGNKFKLKDGLTSNKRIWGMSEVRLFTSHVNWYNKYYKLRSVTIDPANSGLAGDDQFTYLYSGGRGYQNISKVKHSV